MSAQRDGGYGRSLACQTDDRRGATRRYGRAAPADAASWSAQELDAARRDQDAITDPQVRRGLLLDGPDRAVVVAHVDDPHEFLGVLGDLVSRDRAADRAH